jgi:hypothetical protein
MGLADILELIAVVVGKSDQADAITQALEDYAEKYPRSYKAAQSIDILGTFLDSLEKAVDARITQ